MQKGEIQWAGFWLAGLLSVVLAVVKLALALPWSWWRAGRGQRETPLACKPGQCCQKTAIKS